MILKDDDDCHCYDGCACDDEVLCSRILETIMIMYGLNECMYVFIDVSMYVFIISFYRHIDYSI